MPFSYFDRIICINLDSRPDRWELVQEEFARVGLLNLVERVPGIPKEEGIIGCTMSHVEAVRRARKQGLKNLLIFEDDVRFINYKVGRIVEALSELPPKWDLFYLGSSCRYSKLRPYSEHLYKVAQDHIGPYTTHAYAINSRIFPTILSHKWIWYYTELEQTRLSDQQMRQAKFIDKFYSDILTPKANIFHINPIMCIQANSYSNVTNRGHTNEQVQQDRFYKAIK